jgi:hypothetical protein
MMCSKLFCKQYTANGISFLPKLVDDFHCPSLSLYRRSTLALSITAFLPFTVISFSQIAADTGPARNFATGFVIFVSSENPPLDAEGSLPVLGKRAGAGF